MPASTSPRRSLKSSGDVGSLAPLEMLEIGEGPGRPQLVVHQDLVLRRLDLVEYGRQLLVFGGNQRGCFLGNVRVAASTTATGSPT